MICDIDRYIDDDIDTNELCPFLRNMVSDYEKTYDEYQHSIIGRHKTESEKKYSDTLSIKLCDIEKDFGIYGNMMERIKNCNESDYMSISSLPDNNELSEVDKLIIGGDNFNKKIFESNTQIFYQLHSNRLHIYKTSDDDFIIYIYDSTLEDGWYDGAVELSPTDLLLVIDKLKEKGWINNTEKKGEDNDGCKSIERDEEII